jgi:hypothetical protein
MWSTLRQRLRSLLHRRTQPEDGRSLSDPYARPPGREPQDWFDRLEDEPTIEI